MIFSSPLFIFYFLPIVFFLYYDFYKSIYVQNAILLLSSLIFYFWGEKEYTIIVIISTLLNYGIGQLLNLVNRDKLKSFVLLSGVGINLAILCYFKYYNFIINEILVRLSLAQPLPETSLIHLPLGISFFTFHGLTYIIDIYRKNAFVAKSPLNAGLYTLFFPQLIAGPIVRYKDIAHQLIHREISSDKLYVGIKRFIIGLSKKLLLANVLGKMADDIYLLPLEHQSSVLSWLAIICYSMQIYFDFSGYSDMAIGLAKLFGFDFLENFNLPYIATSIRDFWRRWHISLTNFFRDYLYIPLGGNRQSKLRTNINLMLVFFCTGLWHGASWNFILWGLWHGLFLLIERSRFGQILDNSTKIVKHAYVLVIVTIGWVFFRHSHLTDIQFQLKKLFLIDRSFSGVYPINYFLSWSFIITFIIAIVLCTSLSIKSKTVSPIFFKYGNTVFYLVLFFLCLMSLSNSTYNPFIYYRF